MFMPNLIIVLSMNLFMKGPTKNPMKDYGLVISRGALKIKTKRIFP